MIFETMDGGGISDCESRVSTFAMIFFLRTKVSNLYVQAYLTKEHNIPAPPHGSLRLVPQYRQIILEEHVLENQNQHAQDHA